MVTETFDIGDAVEITGKFTDLAGAAADPDTITVKVREPDGTLTTKTDADPEVTSSTVGTWVYNFTITQAGRHAVRWEGTGTVTAAGPSEFYARAKDTD
ncbi:MAG: hypothetical protein IH904_00070 [Proteobacteria bacterium]|nr:hypothetical protein [Pseudomonadota bacterium]